MPDEKDLLELGHAARMADEVVEVEVVEVAEVVEG